MIPVLITGGTEKERLAKAKTHFSPLLLDPLLTSNPNFLFLDSQTSIGIDEVRDLQKRLSLKPFGPGPKVAIINNAQNLTIAAQNAFLKTLEEPPKNSQIILTAPTIESLLPTVVSRCQIINLPLKSQISLTKEEISQFRNFLISLFSSSIGERFKKIDELNLAKDRQKAIEWVNIQTIVVREALLGLLKSSPSLPSFPSKPSLTPNQLLSILQSLLKTKLYLQANVNTRLALDNFLLDLPKRKC